MGTRSKQRKRRRSSSPKRGDQLWLRASGGRGGYRARAGRPRGGRTVLHRRRPRLDGVNPVHVTLRVRDDVPRLRTGRRFRVIQRCIQLCHKAGFRVVEFSVMQNHLHLICEAADEGSLARGMQGLKTRLARRLNAELGRRGTLFAERYHARALTTPTEVKNALCYCLNNARRHLWKSERRLAPAQWIDGYSSAPGFDGYRGRRGSRRAVELGGRAVVQAPKTWLLRVGWTRAGALRVDDVPGRQLRNGESV